MPRLRAVLAIMILVVLSAEVRHMAGGVTSTHLQPGVQALSTHHVQTVPFQTSAGITAAAGP